MTRVLVILPIYNCLTYLNKTLLSLRNQTYTDWHCICVDDGSTDGSKMLAEYYQSIYPDRFTVLTQENAGAASARNKAIYYGLDTFPEAEYIALLDGDDIWLPNKLEKQVEHLDTYAYTNIVCSWYQLINEYGDEGKVVRIPKGIGRVALSIENYVATSSNPMIRRTALEESNIEGYFFNPNLKRCDDHEAWIRILSFSAGDIYFIPDVLFQYRITPLSLQSKVDAQYEEWPKLFECVNEYAPQLINKRLAKAYQCKTVAIRAMRNKDWRGAIKYALKAIKSDWRIVPEYIQSKFAV